MELEKRRKISAKGAKRELQWSQKRVQNWRKIMSEIETRKETDN